MKMDNSITTKLRNELITFAKMKRTLDYVSVGQAVGIPSGEVDKIDELLKQVSMQDHSDQKPLLWSIVLNNDSNLPSHSYFDLLTSIGVKVDDPSRTHRQELERVFAYWARRRKTGKRR